MMQDRQRWKERTAGCWPERPPRQREYHYIMPGFISMKAPVQPIGATQRPFELVHVVQL